MDLWLAVIISAAVGFATAFLLGFCLIPLLHKLKFGQTILDIGPSWHKKKQGTPTMGGFLFIAGFAVSFALILAIDHFMDGDIITFGGEISDVLRVKIFAGISMAVCFGMIGFIDDYIKVVKKRNLGLTELQKTVLQLLVIVAYLFTLDKFAGVNYMFIPYHGIWENTAVFWILGVVTIYCTVNAVNFLDGVDGLCSGVTAAVSIAFAVCAVLRNVAGLSVVCSSLFGALIGYLIWNWNPAKVMMGDIGSLFLGGMVCCMAYSMDAPWLILLIGVIYVAEFGSDILQIVYVKTHNGKRLFKMAPLHHHYEKSGWSEKKICVVFILVTIVGSAAGIALTYFGRTM